MEKQIVKATDGSKVTQIASVDKLNIEYHYLNSKNTIKHCGKCNETFSKRKENVSFCNTFKHCNDRKKISEVENYLMYEYVKLLVNKSHKYIKPTLSISEYPFEFGTSLIDTYEDCSFFLSENHNQYIIIGEGGIGKSQFLSNLFADLINKAFTTDNIIVPFIVNCDFYGHDDLSPKEWLFSKINSSYPSLDIESVLSNQNYKIYFLIDAINSIQYENKNDFENKIKKWVQFVKEYCETYDNLNFVITSRDINEINYFESHRQKNIYIEHLESNKINDFIALFVDDNELKSELISLVSSNKDMYFLGIPYFLLKIIESRKKDEKISNKTDIVLIYASFLFEKHSRLIKEREVKKRKFKDKQFYDLLINKETSFFEIIFYCAFLCQEQNKKVLNSSDITNATNQFKKDISLILQIAVEEKILSQTGNVYTFSHPILQEFFAAMYIYADLEKNYKLNKMLPFDDETMNLEIAPHLYNLVTNKDEFISEIIKGNKLIYAAECVLNNGKTLKEKVAKAILEYLEIKSCSKNERVALGKYLGKIGDPRFSIDSNANYIEPKTVSVIGLNNIKVAIYPITNKEFSLFINDNGYQCDSYWNEASDCNWLNYDFVIKSIFNYWKNIRERFNTNKNAFDDFCKSSAVDIEQCASLAYLLNTEDEELLKLLSNLYKKEKFSKPMLWDDPKYNNPSQPVVGISYFEALAYCSWLSDKCNKKYRLLSKEEWERAAKPKQNGYVFDYGISPDNCNTLEAEYQTILPVGILEQNRTKDGIYDLNGNIFEWTSSVYKYGNNLLDTQLYVKGGSWVQKKERALSKYNGRAKAWCRNLDVGFRVCLDEN